MWWTKYTSEQIDQAIENALAGPGGGAASLIHQASKRLTHAEMAAAGTPVVVVPATEVLGYAGFPTRFPVLVSGSLLLDTRAGAYTNVSNDGYLAIVLGSDWSAIASSLILAHGCLDNAKRVYAPWGPPFASAVAGFAGVPAASNLLNPASLGIFDDGDLQDNALAFVGVNASAGSFADGHVDNYGDLTLLFTVYDVPLKRNLTVAESGWQESTRTFA